MTRRFPIRATIAMVALALSGCTTLSYNSASNVALPASGPSRPTVPRDPMGTHAIALSFSGGGLRAAAFSQGVLEALARMRTPDGDLLDDVSMIGSVSGGSLTAAYFGLHGRAGLSRFRDEVLLQDIEQDLRMSLLPPWNLARALGGGLNLREDFGDSLDRRVFRGATFGDLLDRHGPEIRIHATDLYHRVAFPFTPTVFSLMCSDFSRYSVADAVAASMAVPVLFAPIVLRVYSDKCPAELPSSLARIRYDADSPLLAKAAEAAIRSYRAQGTEHYIKLADGGLSDNLGLSTIVLSRLVRGVPYAPLSEADAVRIRRLLFLVVDASRGPTGDWNRSEAGPSGLTLALAAGDAATDATARLAADSFERTVLELQQAVVAYRCDLTLPEVARLGGPAPDQWRCDDVKFSLAFISIDRVDDAARREAIAAIPTRLSLPPEQVDLAVQGGREATLASPRLHRYFLERTGARVGGR